MTPGTGGTGTDTFGKTETFVNINAISGSMVTATGDSVTGNDYFNYFEGLSGADTFNGGGGQDRYGYNNEANPGFGGSGGVIVNLSGASITAPSPQGHSQSPPIRHGIRLVLPTPSAPASPAALRLQMSRKSSAPTSMTTSSAATPTTPSSARAATTPSSSATASIMSKPTAAMTPSTAQPQPPVTTSPTKTATWSATIITPTGLYMDLNDETVFDPTGGTDTIIDIERIRATLGNDTIIGADFANEREELFMGLSGNDTIDGRNGYNIADYTRDGEIKNAVGVAGTQGIIANLSGESITIGLNTVAASSVRDGYGNTDTLVYIQGVRGSIYADTFLGNDARNIFRVVDGTDTVNGGAGNDAVEMYMGDYFVGDAITGGGTGAIVDLTAGTARAAHQGLVTLGAISTLISIEDVGGSTLNDTISGNGDSNALGGWFGDDSISGLAGNDFIGGGQGSDTLDGGADFDFVSYLFDPTVDDYHLREYSNLFSTQWGGVRVNLSTSSAVLNGQTVAAGTALGPDWNAAAPTVGVDVLSNFEGVVGSFYADSILGDNSDNTLYGLSGNDTLDGNGGTDTVSYAVWNGDGRVLVPIAGINASMPNGVIVNLAAGTASDGEGGNDTLISIENVIGSKGDDLITGSAAANRIDGGAGNDTVVYAGSESDYNRSSGNGVITVQNIATGVIDTLIDINTLIFTGAALLAANGNPPLMSAGSTVNLTAPNFTTTGTTGDDIIIGTEGNDTINGVAGLDVITGGVGADSISGGDNADELRGSDGADIVNGGNDADLIIAGRLNGASGSDGDDTYNGDGGIDTVSYAEITTAVIVNLAAALHQGTGTDIGNDELSGIENVLGGIGNDSITGDGAANLLLGDAGADTLAGGDNADTLQGGSSNDRLAGNSGDDSLFGDSDDDVILGGSGNDTLNGGTNSYAGGDTADYSDATAAVIAALSSGGGGSATGDGTDAFVDIENLTGGGFADSLTGNDAANVLSGAAGNDTLDGGAGVDSLNGGAGNDVIFYDAADNLAAVLGGADTDTLVFTAGAAPTTFDLTAHQFEKAEGRFADPGANAWTSYVDNYDIAWRKTHQTGLMDSGQTYFEDYDELGTETWVRITYWNDASAAPMSKPASSTTAAFTTVTTTMAIFTAGRASTTGAMRSPAPMSRPASSTMAAPTIPISTTAMPSSGTASTTGPTASAASTTRTATTMPTTPRVPAGPGRSTTIRPTSSPGPASNASGTPPACCSPRRFSDPAPGVRAST